jgi:alpha-glucoside transport system permease protein
MNIAIPLIRMTVGELLARISLLLIVILWSIPTFGLLVSSFRTRDAIATTGWWTSLRTNVQTAVFRTGTEGEQVGEEYVISGTHFEDSRIAENATITAFGTTANNPSEVVSRGDRAS